MKIIVGSTSTHKITAVRVACARLDSEHQIAGVKTASGQNEQPVGFDETFLGALTRAIQAKKAHPESTAIGIESGIFRFGKGIIPGVLPITLDIAVIVILTKDGRQIVTTSAGVEFPEECVRKAEERGFETTTVGSIITEKFGGDPTNPHSILTKGKVTRTQTLVDALVVALSQM